MRRRFRYDYGPGPGPGHPPVKNWGGSLIVFALLLGGAAFWYFDHMKHHPHHGHEAEEPAVKREREERDRRRTSMQEAYDAYDIERRRKDKAYDDRSREMAREVIASLKNPRRAAPPVQPRRPAPVSPPRPGEPGYALEKFRASRSAEALQYQVPKPVDFESVGHEDSKGGMVSRLNIRDLPLRLYSNHRQFKGDATFDAIVDKAVALWNEAGVNAMLSTGFFVRVHSAEFSNINVDWSGRATQKIISRKSAGVAQLGYSFGLKVGMWTPGDYQASASFKTGRDHEGPLLEVLLQELGHIIGLGHSGGEAGHAPADHVGKNDIMFPRTHRHEGGEHQTIGSVRFSDRDFLMLCWLYSQKPYQPIISKRKPK